MPNSIVIRNGRILYGSPAREICGDLFIENGRIKAVGNVSGNFQAIREIDAAACWVLPGIIDPHAHYISPDPCGYYMLTAAGVTTALEPIALVGSASRQQITAAAAGLNCAALYLLIPGRTLPDRDPDDQAIVDAIKKSRNDGFLGIKLAGAHFPFTARAMSRIIRIAAEMRCVLMIHAGSTVERDDYNGMREAVQCSKGYPFIMAHVNSYCTGKNVEEQCLYARKALRLLEENPRIVSESTFSTLGCVGCRMINGVPESLCLRDMLEQNGFEATYDGLLAAIACGKFSASGQSGDVYDWLPAAEGVELCRKQNGHLTVSVPSHAREKNNLIASARRSNGNFVVNAFSSDGGIIPRNVILQKGLECVKENIFSISDFVHKSALAGAQMLGLEKRKGVIAEGFDGDVIVVDPENQRNLYTVSGGTIVYEKGLFNSKENIFISEFEHTPTWMM